MSNYTGKTILFSLISFVLFGCTSANKNPLGDIPQGAAIGNNQTTDNNTLEETPLETNDVEQVEAVEEQVEELIEVAEEQMNDVVAQEHDNPNEDIALQNLDEQSPNQNADDDGEDTQVTIPADHVIQKENEETGIKEEEDKVEEEDKKEEKIKEDEVVAEEVGNNEKVVVAEEEEEEDSFANYIINNQGWNSFMKACYSGTINAVKTLFPKVNDINYKSSDNKTALIAAVEGNRDEAVEFLLSNGATPSKELFELAFAKEAWRSVVVLLANSVTAQLLDESIGRSILEQLKKSKDWDVDMHKKICVRLLTEKYPPAE